MTEVAANNRPGILRGQVRWQPEGVGGELDLDLDGFQSWLDGFLAGPLARGKIDKVTAVLGDIERHLSVGVSWSAPWAVLRLLDHDVDALPTQAPSLPMGLSHLWIWGCEPSAARALCVVARAGMVRRRSAMGDRIDIVRPPALCARQKLAEPRLLPKHRSTLGGFAAE